jgi:S-adenosylmethionine-dependent methyltransferase
MSLVERFYDENAQYTWDRLDRHRTEFAVTMRALKEYLPKPPATILDIGGGPGRYAIALAQHGYEVTLVDLSKSCLEFARQKAQEASVELVDYIHANATDLSAFPAEHYDSALLMGPLYHLLTAEEQQKAVSEAKRVIRSEGYIFAAFITRYAPIRNFAKNDPLWIIENHQQFKDLLATGVGRDHKGGSFIDAYFSHPSEIEPLMEQAGFETLDLIACEGIISMIDEQINELTDEAWEIWMDINYRLSKDASVHGTADHLLYVGRNAK